MSEALLYIGIPSLLFFSLFEYLIIKRDWVKKFAKANGYKTWGLSDFIILNFLNLVTSLVLGLVAGTMIKGLVDVGLYHSSMIVGSITLAVLIKYSLWQVYKKVNNIK